MTTKPETDVKPCACLSWCWAGVRFQAKSKHHPSCPHYEGVTYKRIDFDGSFCIVEPRELADMTVDLEGENFVVTDVTMTREEFESLPDFGGW